jgi:hypothetical protein
MSASPGAILSTIFTSYFQFNLKRSFNLTQLINHRHQLVFFEGIFDCRLKALTTGTLILRGQVLQVKQDLLGQVSRPWKRGQLKLFNYM